MGGDAQRRGRRSESRGKDGGGGGDPEHRRWLMQNGFMINREDVDGKGRWSGNKGSGRKGRGEDYYRNAGDDRGSRDRGNDDRGNYGYRGNYRDRDDDRGGYQHRGGGDDRGHRDDDRGSYQHRGGGYGDRGGGYRDQSGGRGGYGDRDKGGYQDRGNSRSNADRSPELRRYPRGKGKGKRTVDEHDLSEPTVWVGGCPNDITERELEKEFSKLGPVTHVTIKHSSRDTFAFVSFEEISHAATAIREMDQAKLFGGIVKVATSNRKSAPAKQTDTHDHPRESREPRPSSAPHGRSRSQSRSRGSRRPQRPRGSPDREQRARDREPVSRGRGYVGSRDGGQRRIRVNLWQLPVDMEDDELIEIASDYGQVLAHGIWKEGKQKCGWLEYATMQEANTCLQELDDRRMDMWDMRIRACVSDQFGR
eukprot:TRINITY_DN4775_c0_g1_i2.p1 TRINITY_DN4775_c0_g1~~TRINITY_DN4775_c0_g1_i2.p1  ORF type:complete len:422 (+),score=61.58 TRINITY_DN4775_c0_g1_i2:47-1312(+)